MHVVLVFFSTGVVVTVDWKLGASLKKYCVDFGTQFINCAAANTKYIGAATQRVVQQLEVLLNFDDRTSKIHCIGHSLGAHACGFFGKEYTKVREGCKLK